MFSAAGGAVIALGDKQAGCNNIINLLTTAEERASFLQSLCHPSGYSRAAGLFVCRAISLRPSGLKVLLLKAVRFGVDSVCQRPRWFCQRLSKQNHKSCLFI